MPRPWERRRVVYRRPLGAAPVRNPDETVADYSARREEDVRRQVEVDREATDRTRRDAYERGVREGRRGHKSHPFLTLIVIALAALGLVFIGLWIRSGSPSQAGSQIGTAAVVAGDRAQDAARTAGAVVQDEVAERTDGDPATPPQTAPADAPPANQEAAPAIATETTRSTTTRQ